MKVGAEQALQRYFSSPRMANAVAVTAFAIGIFAEAVQRTVGWPGHIAALAALVSVAVVVLMARRSELKWQAVLPISLLAFVAWTCLTALWSQYQWATIGGLAYFLAFTVVGVTVALTRDSIQIVRAFGDVLRAALGLSLALEVLAGALIDSPIPFLGVQGNLAEFGPIQGVMGTRNQLALIAVLALITFGTELHTKSIGRGLGLGSILGAATVLALTKSPVLLAVAFVVGIAALALYGLRRVPPQRRTTWQLVTLGAFIILAVVAWMFRYPIISVFRASAELEYRQTLWRRLWGLIGVHPLEGWGWIGQWRPDVQPFPAFEIPGEREPSAAYNAYLDAWFQLGLVGATIFVALVLLAFTRSWLLAGRQRSIVFSWPALVLGTFILVSFAESSMLVEYGWLTFVVCCVKASRELSWRSAFTPPSAAG